MCWLRWFGKKEAPVKVVWPVRLTATEAEIKKSLAIIAEGRANHQYYVDHPSTDPEVGDPAHNQMWVDNYDLLKSVIERLSKC